MKPRIIGICGQAGVGKDTVAGMLTPHGYNACALSDPMKKFCSELFGWGRDRLYGASEKRNEPDPKWDGLTARRALQTLGTEWGRACHEDVWIRYALRPGGYRTFTDLRFINEVTAFKAAGACLIRIYRPCAGLVGNAATHASEVEQTSIHDNVFDHVIHNTGTLEDLRRIVNNIADTWKPL